jgi:hypothetical protein
VLEITTAWRPAKDPADIRHLIRDMDIANPLWGAPRIHGEPLKLGIDVGPTTVAKHMARTRRPPSQGWKTFLRNHADGLASIDLFVVPAIFLIWTSGPAAFAAEAFVVGRDATSKCRMDCPSINRGLRLEWAAALYQYRLRSRRSAYRNQSRRLQLHPLRRPRVECIAGRDYSRQAARCEDKSLVPGRAPASPRAWSSYAARLSLDRTQMQGADNASWNVFWAVTSHKEGKSSNRFPCPLPNLQSRNRAGAVTNQSLARQATRLEPPENMVRPANLRNRNALDRYFDHTDVDLVGSRNPPDRPSSPCRHATSTVTRGKPNDKVRLPVAPLWALARMKTGAKLLCAGSPFAISPG